MRDNPEWWRTPPDYAPESMELLSVEEVPCTTSQWNFPHDRTMPWVDDNGRCSICRAEVQSITISPLRPYLYTRVARPHTRTIAFLRISSDDLGGLIEYAREW